MLTNAYATIRKKVLGDPNGEGKAPWYTRWAWWVLAISLGIIVFALWYGSKAREAQRKAASAAADAKARQARTKALNERDAEDASELVKEAEKAEKKAERLHKKMQKTEEKRKKIEASIKGAKSWEELERIEEELG